MHEVERGTEATGAASAASAEAARTSRQCALPWVGDVGQRRLRAARILVIGAGGLAAPIVQYLAAAGVGALDIVDFDTIEPSNLARQVLFTPADIGRFKAPALAEAAARLSPGARIEGHRMHLVPETATDAVRGLAPDLVIDTTDDWATRLAVADACRELHIALVWPSVIGTDGQLTVFTGEPGDPTIDDLVDRETAPLHPVSCAAQGVLGPVCGQLGAMAATEAMKLLLDAGKPLVGRVAIVDGLAATVREVALVPRRTAHAAPPAQEPKDAVEPRDAASVVAIVPNVRTQVVRQRSAAVVMQQPVAGAGTASPSRHVSPGPSTAARSAGESSASAGDHRLVPSREAARGMREGITSIDEMVESPLGTVLVDAREAAAPPLPWPVAGLELVDLVRVPLESLASAIDAGDLPRSIERASRVVVTCAFGPRARHAAAMLRAAGVPGVAVLDEGTGGLRRAATAAVEGEEVAHG